MVFEKFQRERDEKVKNETLELVAKGKEMLEQGIEIEKISKETGFSIEHIKIIECLRRDNKKLGYAIGKTETSEPINLEKMRDVTHLCTAADVMKSIENLNNSERIKLLDQLFDKYFDNRPPKDVIEEEKIREMWGEYDDEPFTLEKFKRKNNLLRLLTEIETEMKKDEIWNDDKILAEYVRYNMLDYFKITDRLIEGIFEHKLARMQESSERRIETIETQKEKKE